MLGYQEANHLLVNAFPEMREIYNDNTDEYIDLPYAFYESEFVPFIMQQLRQNSEPALDKIFGFIESLLAEGDEELINLADVAIVESLFFEDDFNKFKSTILNLCGDITRRSFDECIS